MSDHLMNNLKKNNVNLNSEDFFSDGSSVLNGKITDQNFSAYFIKDVDFYSNSTSDTANQKEDTEVLFGNINSAEFALLQSDAMPAAPNVNSGEPTANSPLHSEITPLNEQKLSSQDDGGISSGRATEQINFYSENGEYPQIDSDGAFSSLNESSGFEPFISSNNFTQAINETVEDVAVSEENEVTVTEEDEPILDVNEGPTAANDSASGNEDSVISGNVLTNDSDVDGTITVQNAGTFDTDHGSITINADGSYDYMADADYNGTDSFDVTIVDDDGATSTSSLNLTVNAVNDGPVIEGVELEEYTNSLSLNQNGATGQVAVLSELNDFPTDEITVQINFSSNEPPQSSETNGISLVSYAASGSDNEFLLFAEPSGNVSAFINGQRTSLDVGDNDLFDGDSHDVAVSWNSETGEISIYVDGSQTDTATGSTGEPISAGGTLVLGQEQDNVGGGFVSYQEFSGEFNSIEIFSEVRSAEEIAADIASPIEGAESTQVLGFDFSSDEPLGNISGDHSFELEGGAVVTNYDAGTTEEDSSGVSGQISASDVDGDDLSYSITNDPAEGSVSIEADGSFHFSPGNDFQDLGLGESREVSFEVEVSDGNGGVDTQSVTVTVTGQNDGPITEALAVETNEDNGITGQLMASDIEGDDLSFSVNEQPVDGSVVVNADGSFTFSPDNDFQDLADGESRETSFSYEVSDNNGGTSIETVTVTVNGTNDTPVIGNITNVVGSLDEAESITGSAMSFNEDGRSGDVAMVQDMSEFPTDELTVELRFSSTEAPDASETNGVSLFSYNAEGGENEFLLFTEPSGSLGVYINGQRTGMDVDMNSLFDGEYHHMAVSWDSASGEISVYIDGNLEDTATAQAGNPIKSGGTMTLGQEQDSLGGGFASNQEFSGKIADVQIFDEVRDAELIETDAATGGTATDDSSLVHAYDFNHTDGADVADQMANNNMSYDGAVMVEDADLPLQMGDVELIAQEDGGTISGTLIAQDAEGDDLSFSLTEGPEEGAVTIDADGNFEFSPGEDFQDLSAGETREVSFTYQVDDGQGGVESATATVTVTGTNDGPVAENDSASGNEDSVISGNVLTNDSDVDGTVTVQNVGTFDTDHGSITINADGSYDYTAAADYNGTDSFEVTIVDDDGATSTSNLSFDIAAVADAPELTMNTSTTNVLNSTAESNDYTNTNNSTWINGEYEGWQTDSSAIEVHDTSYTGYTASEGSQWIELNEGGGNADATNIYRMVDTDENGSYEISFDVSPRPGYDDNVNSIEVYWDNELVDTISLDGSGNTDNNWETHTYTVEGDGDPARFELRSSGSEMNGGRGMFLDNIQIEETVPDAGDAAAQGSLGSSIELPDIIANLTDTDGSESLTFSISDIPEGSVLSDGDGNSFTATDDEDSVDVSDWNLNDLSIEAPAGTESFDLQVNATAIESSNGDASTTSYAINVDIVNSGPTATDDNASGAEDSVISGNVITNDSDVDGTITVQNAGTFDTDHGSITINSDGSYDYTADADYHGADSFEVTIVDDDGATSSSTLNLTVVEDNVMVSNAYNDIMVGTDGVDEIHGDTGEEIIFAGGGDDTIISDTNQDRAAGGDGDDTFTGGSQQDFMYGQAGDDVATGEGGDDYYVFKAGEGNDTFSGDGGSDTLLVRGADGGVPDPADYAINLTSGSATLNGDQYDLSADAVGSIDFTDGSSVTFDGVETISFADDFSYDDNTIKFTDGSGETVSGGGQEDTLIGGDGADVLSGGSNEDLIFGGAGNDTIDGGSENDLLLGEAGNDNITGGSGDDVLIGGAGDDTLTGGTGNDTIYGGDGDDTLTFLAHQGSDVVDGGEGGTWTDTLELSGFDGQGSEDGWTLSLADGSSVSSTDELNGEMFLSGDAGGTITFDDGGSVDFENIEKIVW